VKREKRKRKAEQRRREREEKKEEARKKRSKPAWPLFFFSARISNHRPCAEAAVPSPLPVSAPGSAEQKRG